MVNYVKIIKGPDVELLDRAVSVHTEVTGAVEIRTEKGRIIYLSKDIASRIRVGL